MKAILYAFILLISFLEIYAQDFWQQTNGPYGGTVFGIAVSPSGAIFATTSSGGGVYRSTDNGNSWEKVNNGLPNTEYRAIAVSPAGEIYVGWGGLYKTSNNGDNWELVNSIGESVNTIAFGAGGSIFVGTYNGRILRSTDNGSNWTLVTSIIGQVVWKILTGPPNMVYAAFAARFRYSTDNGTTWTEITPMPGLDLTFDSNGMLLLSSGNGVFRSSNNGANWTRILDTSSIKSIAVAPNGTIFAGRSSSQIYKSTDNGNTWFTVFGVNISGYLPDIDDIVIKDDGKIFAGIYYLGLLRSFDNGNTWQRCNSGLTNQRMGPLVGAPNGSVYGGTFNDGLFRTTNQGNSWSQIGLANKYVTAIKLSPSSVFYCSTPNDQGGLFNSTDGGNNWVSWNTGLTNPNLSTLAFTSSGTMYMGSGTDGIYRSTDNGNSWIVVGFSGRFVSATYIHSNDYIFAGVSPPGGMYRSTNNGTNWTRLDSTILQGSVQVIMGDPFGMLYVSSDKIYRSSNNGNNWIITNPVPFNILTVNTLGHLFGNSSNGVYRSTDGGFNWTQIISGLFYLQTGALTIDIYGYLYVGTWGSGVFKSVQTTTGTELITHEIPSDYHLYPNYPNPFNPVTKIRFDIPANVKRLPDGKAGETSNVKLVIFDLLGREVAALVNEELKPGTYEVQWDGTNYPSGVYFYKLNSGDYSETKKAVFVK